MNVSHIDCLYLDDLKFEGLGYGMLKHTNQLQYPVQPGRQTEGAMTTINEVDSFVLPSVEIGFMLISAENFTRLRKFLLAKRTFIARYFDLDFGRFVAHEMYAHPDQLKAFLNRGEQIIGVQNFVLTLVATLKYKDCVLPEEYGVGANDPITYDVSQHFGKGASNQGVFTAKFKVSGKEDVTEQAHWGRSIKLPELPNGATYWQPTEGALLTDIEGIKFYQDDRVNIFENTTFTAV